MSRNLPPLSETDQKIFEIYAQFGRQIRALLTGQPLPEKKELIDHMLLGREPLSFSFPDRRRAPFARATNAVQPGPEPAPPTVESLKEMMSKIPEPEIVVIHKPSGVGMTERQFLDLFFGVPRVPMPIVEPEKIGTAVLLRRR